LPLSATQDIAAAYRADVLEELEMGLVQPFSF